MPAGSGAGICKPPVQAHTSALSALPTFAALNVEVGAQYVAYALRKMKNGYALLSRG